jgi:glycosyltransferase involved in cell wall biosynthesis
VTAPHLSVVIPSRDGAARLPETLQMLAAQRVAAPFEVVVVDDGSADATADVAAAARGAVPVRVLRHDTARGRAAACNTGVEAARAPVVVVLDDDMSLRPEALEAHRAFHAAAPRAAARGKVVLAPPSRDDCFARFLRREEAFEEQRLLARRHDVPFSMSQTGHWSVPRAVLVEAGGFDASITRYGFEDIELGYRLERRGVRLVFLPEAVAVHRAFATDLDRYIERHREAGLVARQLALRHPEGPFRDYLRVDPPARLGFGHDRAGLAALRLANRLLQKRAVLRLLASRAGFAALRGSLRLMESVGAERAAHFGYHVARDVRYFEGLLGAGNAPKGR